MSPKLHVERTLSITALALTLSACTSIPDASVVLRNQPDGGPSSGAGQSGGGCTTGGDESTLPCNDTFATATTVFYGQPAAGVIDAARPDGTVDRDVFRFEASSGDLIQIRVSRAPGSTLQPYFALFNADGDRYHNGPRTGATGSARGQFFVDVGGTFYVEVSDLRHHSATFEPVGGADLTYRIEVRNLPLADAEAILPPFTSGVSTLPEQRVLPKYRFDADRGTRIIAEVTAMRLDPPSQLDTVLRLINISVSPVQVVDVQDDMDFAAGNKDARIDMYAEAAGTYVVLVDDISFPEATRRTFNLTITATKPTGADITGTTSATLQWLRDRADENPTGFDVSRPLPNLVVTYVKPSVAGSNGGDEPGFFVQSQASGPAMFVAVPPETFAPAPAAGDTVSFTAKRVDRLGGVRRIVALSDLLRTQQGLDLTGLMQNVSNVNFKSVTALDALESELVLLSGTINSDFEESGAGFTSARITTFGTADATDHLRVRVPAALRETLGLRAGCRVTLTRVPLWRAGEGDGAEAQPSAFRSDDFTTIDCN